MEAVQLSVLVVAVRVSWFVLLLLAVNEKSQIILFFFFLNYLQSQQMLPQAEFNFVRLCVSKWEKKKQEETQECSSKWEG